MAKPALPQLYQFAFFRVRSQTNKRIFNLKTRDLDSIHIESNVLKLEGEFFAFTNFSKEMQNAFLDTKILILDFPKERRRRKKF